MYDYNQPNLSEVLTDFMLALWHGNKLYKLCLVLLAHNRFNWQMYLTLQNR